MSYTIWRVGQDGESFQLSNMGSTANKERAMEKVRNLNERLHQSEPNTTDRFVVRDASGKEMKPGA
ncbi:MAG: hypothetical protein KDK37_14525 [Leptospiraceae bacterium]|nr:hypothetical protein [Leptospiraceae bacterium]MCB1305498.1 hypothetical protein [Leptospiraceae bacterium]